MSVLTEPQKGPLARVLGPLPVPSESVKRESEYAGISGLVAEYVAMEILCRKGQEMAPIAGRKTCSLSDELKRVFLSSQRMHSRTKSVSTHKLYLAMKLEGS